MVNFKHPFTVVPVLLALLTSCGSSFSSTIPVLWSLPINGIGEQAIVANQMIGYSIVDENDIRLTTVDLETQKVLWTSVDPQPLTFPENIVGNGTHWFSHVESGNFLEVYRADGTLVKTIDYPNPGDGNQNGLSPVIHNNTLYVGSGKNLYTFDITLPETPVLKWDIVFAQRLNDLKVDEQGYVYVAIFEKAIESVFKIDPSNQTTLWSASTYVQVPNYVAVKYPTSIALNEQRLIVGTGITVQAFDTKTGERLWTTKQLFCGQVPGFIWHLEFGGDNVHFTMGSSCVKAVNLTTGEVVWEFDSDPASNGLGVTFGDKALYHNGVVYAYNGTLWALDARTGNVLSQQKDKDSTSNFSSVHLYNNQILIWNKYLTAYKPIR